MTSKRLIITTSDSGAGHLKQARIADKVIEMSHRLVRGPVPAVADAAAFFEARLAAHDADAGNGDDVEDWERESWASILGLAWRQLLPLCEAFDRVELWIDPDPNAQLVLIQLLDLFRHREGLVDKLALVHADSPLGERGAEDIRSSNPSFQKVGRSELDAAQRAWNAYAQSTPQAWFELLATDLGALPRLRETVLQLLGELPDAVTALGATERMLLTLVAAREGGPFDVFPGHKKDNPLRVLGYWEVGRALDHLARCSAPAVLGLNEGPFTTAMHADRARFQRYGQSRLSLSELGKALVEKRDDFARHNPIHRWWGGTKLTNENLWRWDAGKHLLIPPSPHRNSGPAEFER